VKEMDDYTDNIIKALLEDSHNYVIIYPNNDLGSQCIINGYEKFKGNSRFRVFPSLRFEYFLTLLKNSQFIIGNSSAGVREAPYYGIPIINIGTRQQNRTIHADINNVDYGFNNIKAALKKIDQVQAQKATTDFGQGDSAQLFMESLENENIWMINHQKQFRDI
jgi:UDP-N-acetylglucosamine 2-epimerase (hydrolysing)